MPIDIATRSELEKKAREHDTTKVRIISAIRKNVQFAIDRLKTAEEDLINEVNTEFGENIFRMLLDSINAGNCHTDEEINKIMSRDVAKDFGPDGYSFSSLLEEIESFKSWRKRSKKDTPLNCFELIPKNLRCSDVASDSITIAWDKVDCDCFYEIETKSLSTVKSIYHSSETEYTISGLNPSTEYFIRVRTIVLQSTRQFIWSDSISVKTERTFSDCAWKECPPYINRNLKYSLDKHNSRIATKINGDEYCTIVGDMTIPLNKVTSWDVKIVNSRGNDGGGINVGIAPYDIKQSEYNNFEKCGWYFYCFKSTLYSGPYHNYDDRLYGPRKGWDGDYVHTGGTVGVVVNTIRRELSFNVNGANFGLAYEGIPLDKPLVPCVILLLKGDSIELIT